MALNCVKPLCLAVILVFSAFWAAAIITDEESVAIDCAARLRQLDETEPVTCEQPGIHKINASVIGSFDVLCNIDLAGPGWAVIQQRINGKEEFYRNWTAYSKGFGSFHGDFFLGLEKIYRLTSAKRHELYIHMERFNGSSYFAHYDDFKISAEADQYKLISLGEFSGDATWDYLRGHENEKFSTFDRDNCHHDKCAKFYRGGWWYSSYTYCNLNGQYYDHEVAEPNGTFWDGYYALKTVKMLIRPTAIALESEEVKLKTDLLKKEIARDCELINNLSGNITKLKAEIKEKDAKILKNKINAEKIAQKLKDIGETPPDSCIPFGGFPGIHKIKAPGIDLLFDVLCNNEIAGSGWTVIQQRINGKEEFNRSWTDYSKGFGSFDGDFFMGLEKIYRLTSAKRHELYIHMERFNDSSYYAHYNQFSISAEADQYRLSVSGFSGNVTTDYFGAHNNHKFSTFDRDNDNSDDFNRAKIHHSGWWHDNYAQCNLNGKYSDGKEHKDTKKEMNIYWYGTIALKIVKILIRPTS